MRRVTCSGSEVRLVTGCRTLAGVVSSIRQLLAEADLPPQPDALILLKPNLNNDLSALTGNSTDLRLIAAVIEALQQRGYTNITIGDGPNVGVHRKGIDVFERLGVRALCAHYGVECVDFNDSSSTEVSLVTGPVRVARLCMEADFFLNLPKLKTHAEAGMSLALKSLIGCVVGIDTRLVHWNLAANIVALNEVIHPDLTIADALVAMEGNGPGDGVPRRVDMLLAADDPFGLDLVAARLFGLDPNGILYLRVAARRGHFSEAHCDAVRRMKPLLRLDPAPPRTALARLLDSRVLAPLRDVTRAVHGQEWVRRLLHRLHILQDVYEEQNARIERLWLDRGQCTHCGLCLDYCPLGLGILDPSFDFGSSACVQCLYCVQVCPVEAIRVEGDLGYLARHFTRYGDAVRRAARSAVDALSENN